MDSLFPRDKLIDCRQKGDDDDSELFKLLLPDVEELIDRVITLDDEVIFVTLLRDLELLTYDLQIKIDHFFNYYDFIIKKMITSKINPINNINIHVTYIKWIIRLIKLLPTYDIYEKQDYKLYPDMHFGIIKYLMIS